MVSMGNVWDRTTAFIGDHLAALLPVALAAIFVPLSVLGNLSPLMKSSAGPEKLLLGLILVLLGVTVLWANLTIIALALDPSRGRDPAGRVAARRLPVVVGVSILVGLAVLLLVIPIPVGLMLGGYDFQAAAAGGDPGAPTGGAALFVGLYALVLVIAIIWFAARIALVNVAIVAERRGIGAIARSFELTRGIVWKIIGIVLLYLIVSQVAELATKAVFGSILALAIGGDGPVTVASVITAVLVGAVTTGFTVIGAVFAAELYLAVSGPRRGIAEPA